MYIQSRVVEFLLEEKPCFILYGVCTRLLDT